MRAAPMIACALPLLLGGGAAGCSLVFGIRDNQGPEIVEGGAEAAGPKDGSVDAADVLAPPDADAAPDARPATGWCANEAGAGHGLCLDFDESDASFGAPCMGGGPCSLSPTSVSPPFSLSTSGMSCGTAFIQPALAHVTAGHQVQVELEWRFDYYAPNAAQPHVLGVFFGTVDAGAGEDYEVFIDPAGGVPYLDEYASWDPSHFGMSATTGAPISAGQWHHLLVHVDLDLKKAYFVVDGTTSTTLDLWHTIGAVSAVRLLLGVDYNGPPCTGMTTVTTYQDNVVADSN